MNHRSMRAAAIFLVLPAWGCAPAVVGALMQGGVNVAVGRAFGGTTNEPEPNLESPIDVRFRGVDFTRPRNWRLERGEPSAFGYPVTVWTYKERGFVRFTVRDRVVDPVFALQASLEEETGEELSPSKPASPAAYGDFHGPGVMTSRRGKKIRMLAFVAAGRTYTVVESASEDDRTVVDTGFQLIETSFRIEGFDPPKTKVLPRAWNAEARQRYSMGRFPEAVTLLLQVQTVCKKSCELADRTAAWMLLGTIQARSDQDGATKTFVDLLRADPSATLDPALATPPARAAFEAARAQVPVVPRASNATPAAPSPGGSNAAPAAPNPAVPAELPAGRFPRMDRAEHSAGSIAGRWAITCAGMSGMIVEIVVEGRRAAGTIAMLGNGGNRSYREGEDILRLEATEKGDWKGEFYWRGASGVEFWDSISVKATATDLYGTMTTDACFRHMQRAQ